MLAELVLSIDHGQIVVHTEGRAARGPLWTDEHVAQGFAWSEGYVAFGVPDHDGECRLQVEVASDAAVDPRALWAVQVPLRVSGSLNVGALFDPHPVAIPLGTYTLIFEASPGDGDVAYVLRLRFLKSDTPEFRILKQGGDLTTATVLRRDADLAG